jgi:hypothetical protein
MTWRSFCESEYNTVGFSIGKHSITGGRGSNYWYWRAGYDIYSNPTDLIESIFYTEY